MTPIILSRDQQIAVVEPSISLKQEVSLEVGEKMDLPDMYLRFQKTKSLTKLDNRDHNKQQHEIFVGLGLKQTFFFQK